ncbi:hypothetical protein [Candidatus Leptofilum sp.]|uniref:hypothetical protein n=1 Tax=Candidatus Leptofilum sp. TaxID=3241576 RepID=UPI003B5C0A20
MNKRERNQRWAETAVSAELSKIRDLPADTNIFIPGNSFWHSLLKMAGLVNGGYKSQETLLSEILAACNHFTIEEKEIRYQWQRACQQAKPRRLNT